MLCVRSGPEECLPSLTFVIQYALYGNSGYNNRAILETQFQGSALNDTQKAFNIAMPKGIVTVEWYFKEVQLY